MRYRKLLRRWRTRNTWTIAVPLLAMGSLPAIAVECVRPGGTGGCFANIQDAVNAASVGETVRVFPGTYFETVTIATANVKLVGRGNAKNIIIDPDEPNTGPGITVNASNVEIDKLTIRNGDSDGIRVNLGANNVSIKRVEVLGPDADCIDIQADGAKVKNSELRGCGSDGVQAGLFNPTNGNQVAGITIEETTVLGAASDGFDITATNAVIHDNWVSLTREDCIRLFGNQGKITKNDLTQCGGNGIDMLPEEDDGVAAIDEFGPAVNGGDDVLIRNNAIIQANDDCIGIAGASADVRNNELELCREDGTIIYGDNANVDNNTLVVSQADCVQIIGDNARINNNDIEHCLFEGVDIDGNGARVTRNWVARLAGDGIDVLGDNALIANNSVAELENSKAFAGGALRGIFARGANHRIENNTLKNGAEGPAILVNGPNPRVVGNTANAFRARGEFSYPLFCSGGSDDGRMCIDDVDCTGGGSCIVVETGEGGPNVVAAGTIIVTCGGYVQHSFTDRGLGCNGGLIARNKVFGGMRTNGFWIAHSNREAGTPDLIVEHNTAEHTSDDGFEIFGSGIVLRRNKALENGDSQANIGDNGFLVFGTDILSEHNLARDNVEDGFHFCGQITSVNDRAIGNAEDGIDVAGDQRDSARYAAISGSNTELNGREIESGLCPEPFTMTTVVLENNQATENLAVGIEISEGSVGSSDIGSTATDNRVNFCDEGIGTIGITPDGDCIVD